MLYIRPNCPINQNEENNILETYMLNVMFISPCIRTTNDKYGKCYASNDNLRNIIIIHFRNSLQNAKKQEFHNCQTRVDNANSNESKVFEKDVK